MTQVLVVSPHHDDEILGVGGTIARFARSGANVHVAIVTTGRPPLFGTEYMDTLRSEAEKANALLGVAEMHFLDFDAARLDTIPHSDVNAALDDLVRSLKPDTAFVPFAGDLHMDHQLVFRSAMVALRPSPDYSPEQVLAYETLSETNWTGANMGPDFNPNTYVDITDTLSLKLEAMATYASQLKHFPNERSLEALEALARVRGATVGVEAAEAFVTVRRLVK